jgi:glycosyltransferase involved in cell wall biosynthesis
MNCRFLYLVGQLSLGGLERQLCSLLKGMDRKHFVPEVVVWNFRENDPYVSQIQALGVPLYSFPGTASRGMKLRAFCRLVMRVRPEVVHSYSFYTNFAAWWATLGTKTIAIGAVRGDFILDKGCDPWLGRLSARWPRSQIFNSFTAADNARRSKGFFVPGQILVVRNGLDLQHFRRAPLPTERRVRIVGIGSLLPVKRWDRLLGAALALKQSEFDFLVRIIGDGPLRGLLQQQAQVLGVADCVEFIDHSDNISGVLGDATFLVHTSDSEGCPNVVMEAMSCGRAVVATDAGDVPHLVEDGKTGFVVARGDDATLVARMVTLITDNQLCQRMGAAGRAKAEREFGLDRLVAETLAAYRDAGWRGS